MSSICGIVTNSTLCFTGDLLLSGGYFVLKYTDPEKWLLPVKAGFEYLNTLCKVSGIILLISIPFLIFSILALVHLSKAERAGSNFPGLETIAEVHSIVEERAPVLLP